MLNLLIINDRNVDLEKKINKKQFQKSNAMNQFEIQFLIFGTFLFEIWKVHDFLFVSWSFC